MEDDFNQLPENVEGRKLQPSTFNADKKFGFRGKTKKVSLNRGSSHKETL